MTVNFLNAQEYVSSSLLNLINEVQDGNSYVISNVSTDYETEIVKSTPSGFEILKLDSYVEIKENQIWLVAEGIKYSFDGKVISTNHYDFNNIIHRSINEIYIFDRDTFEFRYVNEGACKNLQYSLDELKKMTPLDIKPEYNLSKFKTRVEPLISGKKKILKFETIHLRKDKTTYPVEVNLSLIEQQGSHYFNAIILDITDRINAENQQLKAKEQLEIVTHNYPSGTISLLDKNLNFIFTEGEGYRKYNIDPKSVIGIPAEQVLTNTFQSLKNAVESIKNGESINYESTYNDEIFRNTCKAIKDDNDNTEYYLLRTIDITDFKKNEHQLLIEKNNYQSIYEALNKSALVSITDSKGIITHANKAFCDTSKFSLNELIGNSHQIVNSGYHPKSFWTNMWKSIAKGQTWRADVKNKAKDGTFYWVDTVINPILDVEGNIKQFLSIRYLTTDKKELENELTKVNKRLKLASQAGNIGVWEWNIENGEIIWDDKMYEIYKCPEYDHTIESWMAFIHPDDLENNIRITDEFFATGKSIEFVFRAVLKDGSIIYIQNNAVSEIFDGTVKKCVGINIDVTDKITSKLEVDRLLNDRQSLLNNLNGIVWEANPVTLDTTYVSDQSFDIAGYDPKDWSKTEGFWIDKVHPDDRDKVNEYLNEELYNGQNHELEYRFKKKDETYIWISDKITIQYENNQPISIRGIMIDITRTKEAEYQTTKLIQDKYDLINSLDGIVWEADAITVEFTYVSNQSMNILGYTPQEWLSDPNFWLNHIHQDDKNWVPEYCVKCINKLENHEFEYRMIHKNGSIVWIKDLVTVIAENGKPKDLRGIMIDITRTKEAELNLEHTLKQLNLGIETAEMGVWELDLKMNKLEWNEQMFKIFEVNKSEFSHNIEEFRSRVFPEDLIIADKEMGKIALGETVKDVKFRIKTKSGTKHIYASGAPVLNDDGEVIKFMGINIDVTQVAQYQDELEKTLRTLNLAIDTANLGIWEMDLKSGDLEWNDQAYNIFEIQKENFSHHIDDFMSMVDERDHEIIHQSTSRTKKGEKTDLSFRIKTKNGIIKHIKSSATPIFNNNQHVERLIGINIDLTDLIINQENLENALKEKDTLFKELHHRIKNNLQMVISLLYLKETGSGDKKLNSFIKETSTKIQSISAIHEQLLQMRGINKLEIKDYLETLVGNLVHTYSDEDTKFSLDLKLDEYMLNIDTVLNVGLIVNEMISNSIKYAHPEGGNGKIKVHLKKNNGHLNLQVADDGIGIPSERLKALEDSYGLQLISLFTKQIKGELEITNKNGTSYNIKFPVYE